MWAQVSFSLEELLGEEYMAAVCRGAAALQGMSEKRAAALSREKVPFFPDAQAQARLLRQVGARLTAGFSLRNPGAPTDSFRRASALDAAPLGGAGPVRLGEDGRLYFAAKSEHYHAPLGHAFPGFRLIDNARALGIPNATHNNTRGFITRLLETSLIAEANQLPPGSPALAAVLASREPQVLNRVINLETGSLAVEAGVKMMLTRFYRADASQPAPRYADKIPVFLVLAGAGGGPDANYHGTTVTAQTLRGMWPEFYRKLEAAGVYRVEPVRPNDAEDFAEKLATYNSGQYKTAGFLHEIVLMNYGALRLQPAYLQAVYRLCRQTDTPVLVDEIQSCMWYGPYLYQRYDLRPDFVVIGKGFSGGEYAASKILTTAQMDTLTQFGALVTNGQEELASLSYLITMAFSRANREEILRCGALFQARLAELPAKYPSLVTCTEGLHHLAAIHFHTVEAAAAYAALVNRGCVDVSAQLYKPHCPPAVLVKPPVILTEPELLELADILDNALAQLEKGGERA